MTALKRRIVDLPDGRYCATEWENAGFDGEVIWRWLTDYYEEHFLGVYTAEGSV